MQPTTATTTATFVEHNGITTTYDVIELHNDSIRNVVRPKSPWRGRSHTCDRLPIRLDRSLKIDCERAPDNLESSVRNTELEDDFQTTRFDQSKKRKHNASVSTPDSDSRSVSSALSLDTPTTDRQRETESSLSSIMAARQRVLERYERKRHLAQKIDDTPSFQRELSVLGGANMSSTSHGPGHVMRFRQRHRVLDPISRT